MEWLDSRCHASSGQVCRLVTKYTKSAVDGDFELLMFRKSGVVSFDLIYQHLGLVRHIEWRSMNEWSGSLDAF